MSFDWLTEYPNIWLNVISGGVCKECFWIRLGFELVDSVEQIVLHSGGGHIQLLSAWIEQNTKEGEVCSSACLHWDIGLLQPLDCDLHHQLPWFSGLELWLNYSTFFPGSPTCRWGFLASVTTWAKSIYLSIFTIGSVSVQNTE